MELESQAAIVTGAGRGIGRAIALELAGLGADIAVVELDAATAQNTADELKQLGRRAKVIRADVTSAADRRSMVEQTMEAFGHIDVLVNNAGIYRGAQPLEVSEDDWDTVLGVNAKAVFFCCQAVLPCMRSGGRGAIVNIASMAGKTPTPTSIPYGVSKSAVISLTRSLAMAFAPEGIRVNCVCPGFVDTDMWRSIDREVGVGMLGKEPGQYSQERAAQIPLGRMEQPDDVARVVGFLASSKSAYMTGQAINVTGGLITYWSLMWFDVADGARDTHYEFTMKEQRRLTAYRGAVRAGLYSDHIKGAYEKRITLASIDTTSSTPARINPDPFMRMGFD